MAVAVDQINTTPVVAGAVTTVSLTTLTVGSGANRYLYVMLSTETVSSAPSVHWDTAGSNQAMTLLATVTDTLSSSKQYAFGLVAPTSGNKTLTATWTGAADSCISAACFTGVDQTGGATSCVVTTATGTNAGAASNSVTSATGNYTLGSWSSGGATNWGTFNQTQWFLSGGTLSYVSAGATATGAASVSYTAVGPSGTAYAFVGANLVAAGAASSAPFVNNTDLPAKAPAPGAVSLKTWIDPLKLQLQGQDTFFAGPGNGPDYDYPNPRGPIPAVELRTWISALRLALLGKDAFYGLAGNPQHDWPNPRGAAPRVVQDWIDPYKVNLNIVIAPFGQANWPNPSAPQRPVTLTTWLDPLKLELAGKDSFFGLGGSPQFDWPVPKAPSRTISFWTWAEPLKILLQGGDTFFGVAGNPQHDWPVPKGFVPGIALSTWLDPLKVELAGQDSFFGLAGNPQHDWPVPRSAARPVQDWIDPYKINLNILIAPFGQSSWPNPSAALRSISLTTWIDPLKLELAGQDAFYGLGGAPQTDWPNPRRPAPLVQGWTDTYKLALNGIPVPFVWQDWTNPRGRPALLLDWTASLNQELLGQDQFFGLAGSPQQNWPNPRGPMPLLQALVSSYSLTLNGVPAPFTQGSWPNPAGPTYAIPLRTWVDPFKGQGTDAFYGLGGSPQFNWPVPAGPSTFATVLRTWVDSVKLELQGKDQFFGTAGNPQHDWPVPKGYPDRFATRPWVWLDTSWMGTTTPVTSIEYQYFARRRLRR